MRCPKCANKVLQKSGGQTKLRTDGPVVFGEDGLCKSKCYWCKAPVTIPIQIKSNATEEQFYIRKP